MFILFNYPTHFLSIYVQDIYKSTIKYVKLARELYIFNCEFKKEHKFLPN